MPTKPPTTDGDERPNAVGAERVNLCHGYVHQPVIGWEVAGRGDACQLRQRRGTSFRCG